MCKINGYQVYGNMLSDKTSENYPVKDLCGECAENYEIISTEAPMGNICEDCGCEDNKEEELEDRKKEIEEKIDEIQNKIGELETELSSYEGKLTELQSELDDIDNQL